MFHMPHFFFLFCIYSHFRFGTVTPDNRQKPEMLIICINFNISQDVLGNRFTSNSWGDIENHVDFTLFSIVNLSCIA